MDFRDYLRLAIMLRDGTSEAEWRSATSRAYYAAFHVARRLLLDLGFAVPRADRSHAFLWLRIANAGHADVELAGNRLNHLRGERNAADYDEHRGMGQLLATRHVQTAEAIIQVLDAAAIEPVRTQITDAMKIYERDVLKDVTWHP
ncbi:MAG: HEPN domain-containing protein [Gemmataceae bacterium]